MTDTDSRGTRSRVIQGAAVTILLGAIGSGVWQFGLAPVFDRLLNVVANVLGDLLRVYRERLYSELGAGGQHTFGREVYTFLMSLLVSLQVIGILALILIRGRMIGRPAMDKVYRFVPNYLLRSNGAFRVFISVGVLSTLALSLQVFERTYRVQTVTWIERSIEIIHPSLSEPAFLHIRSEYRSVSNAGDFYKLFNHIQQLAASQGIVLPEFDPIGKDAAR
jgi:hypothetical protein